MAVQAPARRKRVSWLTVREWLEGYFFASPFIIGFLVFTAFPMLAEPRDSGSDLPMGMDTGTASFFDSMGLGAAGGGLGGEYGLSGSSSRRLFHIRTPSRLKYEYVHDTAPHSLAGGC